MKLYKKFIFFLAAICFCISVFLIVQTFAKYATSASGSANIPIARWNISVNSLSIKNNTNISATLTPVFPGNDHIASNIIAPTAEGYFDIIFDFSKADVSFLYNITMSVNENSVVKDFIPTGYSIDGGPITNFTGSDRDISEQINYLDEVTNRTIRVYLIWDDSAQNSIMNNTEDVLATNIPGGNALIDVNISFTQTLQ